MNGFNDNYLSGQTITGQSPLEEAVQDVISGGLQSDLNMNGKRIYGIPTTAITDNEAMSRKETYDLFV